MCECELDWGIERNVSDKACTNCSANEFYTAEINGGGGLSPDLLPVGFFHGSRYQIVVCGDCGHTRWFVPKEFLRLVKDKFAKLDI